MAKQGNALASRLWTLTRSSQRHLYPLRSIPNAIRRPPLPRNQVLPGGLCARSLPGEVKHRRAIIIIIFNAPTPTHRQQLSALEQGPMLQAYQKHWLAYRQGVRYLDNLFSYFNRVVLAKYRPSATDSALASSQAPQRKLSLESPVEISQVSAKRVEWGGGGGDGVEGDIRYLLLYHCALPSPSHPIPSNPIPRPSNIPAVHHPPLLSPSPLLLPLPILFPIPSSSSPSLLACPSNMEEAVAG